MKTQLVKLGNALIIKYGKGKKNVAPVTSFIQAKKICLDFIEANSFGASGWGNAGQIFNIEGKQVGHISYNGKIWDIDNKEISNEVASKQYY